jgi:hypothetical protein
MRQVLEPRVIQTSLVRIRLRLVIHHTRTERSHTVDNCAHKTLAHNNQHTHIQFEPERFPQWPVLSISVSAQSAHHIFAQDVQLQAIRDRMQFETVLLPVSGRLRAHDHVHAQLDTYVDHDRH